MIKKYISLYTKQKYLVTYLLLMVFVPLTSFAALSNSNPAKDYLTRASFFIKEIIIPVLFGIAFLFFLVNMVRYYIIGATSEDSRAKAHRNALYGLGAFVFLISIWSIISILLSGFNIDTQNKSLCPDYMKELDGTCGNIDGQQIRQSSFGSVSFPDNTNIATYGRDTNRNTSGSYENTRGRGNNGNQRLGTGDRVNTPVNRTQTSGLAELIFGTGKDSAIFTQFSGSPRAVYQTPQIANAATCASGINTLTLANRTETTQAAYALYKTSNGSTRWENITDLNSTNHIAYDKDVLDSLLSDGATDVYIIHTHPSNRIDNLNLTMVGHGPSTADFKAMCGISTPNISYAVIDTGGIWTYAPKADTCPYSNAASNILPVIETYGALATLEPSVRQAEHLAYIKSAITPTQYKNYFSDISTQQFQNMTPEELFSLSNYYQQYASTTITYQQSADIFCSTY